MNTARLILASASPYRQEQLRILGFEFEVDVPNVDESRVEYESPSDLALRLSKDKALIVSSRHSDATVIGADQVAEIKGGILEKPGTEEKAREMLEKMSANHARFHSAVTVVHRREVVQSFIESTDIDFRSLSVTEIDNYVRLDQPLNCAGAIKSESKGSLLFERVKSDDPSALIGLPLIKLAGILRTMGINPLQ